MLKDLLAKIRDAQAKRKDTLKNKNGKNNSLPTSPANAPADISLKPEKSTRVNKFFVYGAACVVVFMFASVGLYSCSRDSEKAASKKPPQVAVPGEMLSDQNMTRINSRNQKSLKEMNDEASGVDEIDLTNVSRRDNTSRRSSSSDDEETSKKRDPTPAEQYELDAQAARYKRALADEASSAADSLSARKSPIFFKLDGKSAEKAKKEKNSGSPANTYYNDVAPRQHGGGDSDYIQVIGR